MAINRPRALALEDRPIPDSELARAATALVEGQVARKSDCHIAGHVGLGMAKKVRAGPFSE